MRKILSYHLSDQAPGWPGNPKMEITPYTLISRGNGSNQYEIKFFNHFGSHMDAPRHCLDEGGCLAELSLDYFFFDKPLLLDIPKSYGELIKSSDFEAHYDRILNADLLMIRSGFSRMRNLDPEGYSARGPGFSGDAAKFLMDHFPGLRGVAMDWISLSSHLHKQEGSTAHKYLLGHFHDRHMIIIEDVTFVNVDKDRLSKVISLPLFIQGVDSGPCTVVAEFEE